MEKIKFTKWVNVYRGQDHKNIRFFGGEFPCEEWARDCGEKTEGYIKTIKVEWEEEQ